MSWLKAARPRHIDSASFAGRCFAASWLAGNVVLGVIGFFTPSALGIPGARAFGNRNASLAVAAVVLVSLAILVIHGARLRWIYRRSREPFIRPLSDNSYFERAADSLASSSDVWQSRWATSWIYWPAALAVAGVVFAFSCAYFLVEAAATEFVIGWEQPLFAAGNGVLSFVSFAAAARRLSTWRLALSVHREVSGRYLD